MSKIWLVIGLLTVLLVGGMWYLYAYPPQMETGIQVDIANIEQVPQVLPEASLPTSRDVTLFVLNTGTGRLERMVREIEKDQELSEQLTHTLEWLLYPEEDVRNEAFPQDTKVLNVFLTSSGIAYVNMSRHIQDHHIGGLAAELLTVSSLVNTVLVNFREEITHVQILVEGAEIETLAGHVDCRKPFSKMLLLHS